jgi:hypothetical protein
MINFFENTDKAAVMPRDSTSNLFRSLPGFSGTVILSFSPPTNRAPKQFFNKITHKMFLDAVMADNNTHSSMPWVAIPPISTFWTTCSSNKQMEDSTRQQ